MNRRHLLNTVLLLALGAGLLQPGAVRGTPLRALTPVTAQASWVTVDPLQPNTVYVGGTMLERSTDGGDTWTDLSQIAPSFHGDGNCRAAPGTLVTTLNSHDLYYLPVTTWPPCYRDQMQSLYRSANQGLTWRLLDRANFVSLAQPISSTRIYDVLGTHQSYLEPPNCTAVRALTTGGIWRAGGDPIRTLPPTALYECPYNLVADPAHPLTLYANLPRVVRSVDGGMTWTTVTTPTTTPAFPAGDLLAVGFDHHEPGLLVGQASGPTPDGDRIFLSADQGHSWSVATCPGARLGACPAFTVDNVFGAGRSYAVFANGIYSFTGAGPALSRLPLSNRLPFPASAIEDMAAGTYVGDPVYILFKKQQGTRQGLLYRGTNGGTSWKLLPAQALPSQAPAGRGAGIIQVRQTHHSVGVAFAATYRKLGLSVIGYPIDEPYVEGPWLTQDFERLELQLRGHMVVVVGIGREVFASLPCFMNAAGPCSSENQHGVAPVENTSTLRYFAATRHTLRGPLLAYWHSHGGIGVFGPPISEQFNASNSDGTGRAYVSQYFANARLELHPEAKNPAQRVQVGLIGDQALVFRGWLPGRILS
jgi:hypothetical protein